MAGYDKMLIVLVCGLMFTGIAASTLQAQSTLPVSEMPSVMRKAGAVLVVQNCLMCHELQYVKYRHLESLGFSAEELTTLRFGRTPDQALQRYMDDRAVRALYGLLPPDLSLMVKIKREQPGYINLLLTSYYQQPDGTFNNHIVPGIQMPDVLNSSLSGDRSKVERQARQVSAFLSWAADPHADVRHALGYGVISYLIILTILLYLIKRRVWSRLG